jgi:plasmid stabilization system protein ParE
VNPRVRFDDEADFEYRLAGQWHEARREHLCTEFLDAVDMTIDRIVAAPGVGAVVRQLPPDLPVRRRAVTRFPYHVVYIELATHIRILAIAHDRRKPGYWERRLK